MFRGPFRLRRSEMNIAIDLIPGPESIDKDRFTYPTFEPTPVLLCVLAPLRDTGLPWRMKQNPRIFKPEGLAQPLPGSVGPGNLYPIWNRKARRADTPISKLELSVR
jgi:hypothetical protein